MPTADAFMRVWRSLPLPVADRLFAPVAPRAGAGRRSCSSAARPSTASASCARPKAELDLVHAAFGIGTDELDALLREHDIGVNLHNEPYPSFENRVCLHLAAGQLVVSETLSPTHGLEPDIDYLEVAEPEQLLAVLRAAVALPARLRARPRPRAAQGRGVPRLARLPAAGRRPAARPAGRSARSAPPAA